MYYLLNLLLLYSLIGNICDATVHFIQPHQTLYETSMQLYSSGNTSSAKMSYSDSIPQWNSVSGLLAPFSSLGVGTYRSNYEDIESGVCALADSFCSFRYDNGTIKSANPESLDDMCLLWDTSCSGNRSLALRKFFGTSTFGDPYVALSGNQCFRQYGGVNLSDCETFNPPSRLSEFQKLKDWMRSSQCASARYENDILPGRTLYHYSNLNVSSLLENEYKCCGDCSFEAGIVDLYYWPEPDADTSCLSIITQTIKPSDYGATIDTGEDPPLTFGAAQV